MNFFEARPVVETLVMEAPGVIGFQQSPRLPLPPGQVRVETLYSGISAGTEMTIYRGSSPYARKRWDAELKMFMPAPESTIHYYPAPLGYEEVGRVVEVGSDSENIAVGDYVWGSWTHRSEVCLPVSAALLNHFPAEDDPRNGIFARIGAIALNGVLDAQINVGETVAVFGAGVVGLICMGLARLSGARVIAVDTNPNRLRRAENYADELLGEGAAVAIKRGTRGHGVDVAIEATGHYAALAEAIRCVAYAGKVVSLGFYQDGGSLPLGEEFHHNRVQILCSQIFAVNPMLSYRWDVPRLERTIMRLQAARKLDLIPLITQEIPFREAASGYNLLDTHPDTALQVVLTFPDALAKLTKGGTE